MPDGCYALVTRFGKDENYSDGNPIWPAGLHFGPPWVRRPSAAAPPPPSRYPPPVGRN